MFAPFRNEKDFSKVKVQLLNSNLVDLMREIGITSPKECEDNEVEDSDDESLRIEDVE